MGTGSQGERGVSRVIPNPPVSGDPACTGWSPEVPSNPKYSVILGEKNPNTCAGTSLCLKCWFVSTLLMFSRLEHFKPALTNTLRRENRWFVQRAGTLWGHCGESVGNMVGPLWGHCGDTAGKLWGHCGDTGNVIRGQ